MSEKTVINKVDYYLSLAGRAYGQDFEMPVICFALTGKTAGSYKRLLDGSCILNFNRLLLEQHTSDFIDRTVPHEVAHLVAYQVFGLKIKPHGREWKQVMGLFNADDSRCHSYDVSKLNTRRYRRFAYECSCRSHQLTSIRHNRVLSGYSYVCKSCKQPLSYQGRA